MAAGAILLVPVIIFFIHIITNSHGPTVVAQPTIPARFDGFVYENRQVQPNSIQIEAFLDPVCPDSREAWPPLKRVLGSYGERLSLTLHPFPLPYHDNAFLSCRGLHVINRLNSSATYSLLELIFEHQEEFYNKPTFNLSRASVVNGMETLATKTVGNSYESTVASGFTDPKTDSLTRISFKYGCSRGVFGTPFFFLNGFPLPDAGSAIDYHGWKKIIDPLIKEQDEDSKDVSYSSF